MTKSRKILTAFLAVLGLLILATIIIVKIYMSVWLLEYVNRTLANMNGYTGHATALEINLLEGAYKIDHLVIERKEGKLPVPFFATDVLSFAVDWRALWQGRILSSMELARPTLNFATSDNGKQYGGGQDWTKVVKALVPIDINRLTLDDGKISFRDFSSNPPVDLDIRHLNGHVENLRNADQANQDLPSPIHVSGDSIGGGKLTFDGRMNILRPFPDMDITASLTSADLTALNSFPEAYANFSFKKGTLDFYSHLIVRDNHVEGFIKPILSNCSVDVTKSSNPLTVVWDTIIAGLTKALTNHENDQIATKAALEGDLHNISPNGWDALVGIFHNAFIEAFQKGFADLDPKAQQKKPDQSDQSQ